MSGRLRDGWGCCQLTVDGCQLPVTRDDGAQPTAPNKKKTRHVERRVGLDWIAVCSGRDQGEVGGLRGHDVEGGLNLGGQLLIIGFDEIRIRGHGGSPWNHSNTGRRGCIIFSGTRLRICSLQITRSIARSITLTSRWHESRCHFILRRVAIVWL